MFLQQLINGITIGSTYALVAIGYSMVFGVLELINFANGSVYMLGGYLTLMLYTGLVGSFGLSFGLGLLLTGIVGYAIDRFGLRRLREKKVPKIAGLITTLGISQIIENAVRIFFGSETKPYPNMLDFGQVTLGNVTITSSQVVILMISILLMLLTSVTVYRTKMGKAMLAGAFYAHYISFIDPSGFTTSASLDLVILAIFGGLGSIPGAILGTTILTVLPEVMRGLMEYRGMIYGVIIVVMMLVKPDGLLGSVNFKYIRQRLQMKAADKEKEAKA